MEAFVWTPEEADKKASSQMGPSDCGSCAVHNVLTGLGFTFTQEEVLQYSSVRSRKYDAPLYEYLLSRVHAGTIHKDLIQAAEKITGGEVTGRFFDFSTKKVHVNVLEWLKSWIDKGGVPVATGNMQVLSTESDAFHHQMIFGIKETSIFVTNQIMEYPKNIFLRYISSESVLSRVDIRNWLLQETNIDLVKFEEPLWTPLKVKEQIQQCLEKVKMKPKSPQVIRIPWGGKTGITIFARKGTQAFNELWTSPDLPIVDNWLDIVDVPSTLSKEDLKEMVDTTLERTQTTNPIIQDFVEMANLFLKDDKWLKCLQQARSFFQFEQFQVENQETIDIRAAEIANKYEIPKENVVSHILGRLKFCFIYSKPGEELKLLEKVFIEEEKSMESKRDKSPIIIKEGDKRKKDIYWNIKNMAYPYVWGTRVTPTFEATKNGKEVGYVFLMKTYIFDLVVHPEYLHQGVGWALLKECFKFLSSIGHSYVTLEVRKSNEPAVALYQKMGFEIQSRHFPPHYDWHGGWSMMAQLSDNLDENS